MEAQLSQILLLALYSLTVLSISFLAYYCALKYDKLWYYAYSMFLIILVQWMSDTGAHLVFFGYYFHLASKILFPSVIFSLFVVYAFQGGKSARQMLNLLLLGNLGYILVVLMLGTLDNLPSYISLNLAWFSNHFFSALAILLDYLTLLSLWPFIHNAHSRLPLFLKIWLITLVVFLIDSLVFNIGTFWDHPNLYAILQSNFILRFFLSLFLSPFLAFYFRTNFFHQGESLEFRSWSDLVSDSEYEREISASHEKIGALEKLESELAEKNRSLEDQRKALANILSDVQTEKEIITTQASELRKFQAAVTQASEMMVFTDPEGIVLWANPATELITGFTAKEAIGKKAGVLWGKLMDKEWYHQLWITIKDKKQTFVSTIKNHRKNQQQFWSNITIYPLLDTHGEIEFFVATQRDITHEIEVDRMKTDFISLASHQLRTPLSAMKWFLEMLLAGDLGKLTKEQIEAITNVEQSNERMISLVNGLLNISRIESGRIIVDPIPTDLIKLTKNVITELKLKFDDKQQVLVPILPKNIPIISLDPKLIHEVLINLLTNANKYTPAKGKISIKLTHNLTTAMFEVSDTGYGIPENEQPKIFERFYRASNITKKETDGTGLGLYLAKAIVESSGGKIWLDSKIGEGSIFYFTVPLKGMKPKKGEVRLS